MDGEIFSEILKKEMVLAMGCTEPAACALAGAKAKELLLVEPETIQIETSRDMFKNAMGVAIPGYPVKGVAAAVALGVAGGNPEEGLSVLTDISAIQKKLAAAYPVKLAIDETVETAVYVKVTLEGNGHESCAVISGCHTCFTYLSSDGQVILDAQELSNGEKVAGAFSDYMKDVSLAGILAYAKHLPADIEQLLLEAAETNRTIAFRSFDKKYGLAVGKTMAEGLHIPPGNKEEAYSLGMALAAGGSDARMAGCQLPVAINSGSGNQGLTITLPIFTLGKFLCKSDREIAEALCISELVGLALTAKKDRLSALCGAFTASIGTACGFVWLEGGDYEKLDQVIKVMVGDLSGVICDGAKMTCALKIHSCLQSAHTACRLVMNGLVPSGYCGIVGTSGSQSIDFLSRISHEGMEKTDMTILDIMLEETEESSG
jgi:L-cysteine desulfidase